MGHRRFDHVTADDGTDPRGGGQGRVGAGINLLVVDGRRQDLPCPLIPTGGWEEVEKGWGHSPLCSCQLTLPWLGHRTGWTRGGEILLTEKHYKKIEGERVNFPIGGKIIKYE